MSDESHGLRSVFNTKNASYRLTFLPAQYLALKEIEASNQSINSDSIYDTYKKSLAFLLTIKLVDFQSEQANNEKMNIQKWIDPISLRIKETFRLNFNGKYYRPLIGTLEYTGGLDSDYNFYLVFPGSIELIDSETIFMEFSDYDKAEIKLDLTTKKLKNIPNPYI